MAMSMKFNTPKPTPTAAASSYATPFLIPTQSIRPPPRRASTSIRSSAEGQDGASSKVDRRNLLLCLGGMYGATAAAGVGLADPVQPPDLAACHVANYPDGNGDNSPVQCCPPYDLSKTLVMQPYVLPTNAPLRTRKRADKLSQFEIDRFNRAVKEMKALPRNHPWNFMQQAQMHCAYCNESYDQKGYSGVPLQVHFSGLFLPWHRWYVYFFEKILGKIVGDDTFALPFWSYDADEEGMKMPAIYKDRTSSLYNPNRNMRHNDQIMYLNWTYDMEDTPVSPTVVNDNWNLLATVFDEDSLTYPKLFMGDPVSAGQEVTASTSELSSGRLENIHNFVHLWVGQVGAPNVDMGNFYSAARDAIFFAHHSQVDRLWEHYRVMRNYAIEFDETDWLEAKFVFYDENQKLVTVTTKQCLDIQSMKYENEDVPMKYLTLPKGNPKPAPAGSPTEFGPSRKTLDSNIVVTVKRPNKAPTTGDQVELLSVDGIELTTPDAAAFEVYLSNSRQDKSELVGTYSRVRHNHTDRGGLFNSMKYVVGITGAVERIGASTDDTVVVTLVPRTGNVTVGGVHVELGPKQSF